MPAEERLYRLSLQAEADLEEIWVYTFETWSIEQADRYHNDLMAAIVALASGSRIGRAVDIREGYFKHPVGSHVIFYRRSDASIDVVRILHQRMDVSRHL